MLETSAVVLTYNVSPAFWARAHQIPFTFNLFISEVTTAKVVINCENVLILL